MLPNSREGALKQRDLRLRGLDLWNDVRFGFRQLLRNKAFCAVLILTLAIGIGVNAAVFSAANAVIFQPLPYNDSSRLVAIFRNSPWLPPGFRSYGVSISDANAIRARSKTLAQLVFYDKEYKIAAADGVARRLPAALVDSDFFSFFGVPARYGRTFAPSDTQGSGDSAVVIGYKIWQDEFDSNPGAIGQTILIDEKRYAIIGVTPATFDFPAGSQLWLPLSVKQFPEWEPEYEAIGRLAPGISLTRAKAELETIREQSHAANREYHFEAIELKDKLIPERYRDPLLILLGVTTFVLLIACVNVATLSLSRGFVRRSEFLIRRMLGATRRCLIRQIIAESLVIALVSGVSSLILAYWGIAMIRADLPADTPRGTGVHAGGALLLFTLFASVAAGLVFGVLPAVLLTRRDAMSFTERSGASVLTASKAGRNQRARDALVTAEVAMAFVLIAGAALALGGLRRTLRIPLGFQGDRVLTMSVHFPPRRFKEPGECAVFTREMLDAVGSIEGLSGVAAAGHVPMLGGINRTHVETEASVTDTGAQLPLVDKNWVTPGFFSVLRVPLLAGRDFSDEDRMATLPVTIVSEAFARAYLSGTAIGKRIAIDSGPGRPLIWRQVVGEVGDIRDVDPEVLPVPTVYLPLYQTAVNFDGVGILSRTADQPTALIGSIRGKIAGLDTGNVVTDIGTMDEWARALDIVPRTRTELLGFFAALSLLLALLGVFGTVSYSVAQRSREISIRMALGATPNAITCLVIREGMIVVGVGIFAGVLGASFLGRSIQALFWGINPNSPHMLVAAAALLVLVSFIACLVPGLRAARMDPMSELRHE